MLLQTIYYILKIKSMPYFISHLYKVILVSLFCLIFANNATAEDTIYSKAFADAIMDRHSDINKLTNKGWEYSNSIVLIGIEKLYYETGNEDYLSYIQNYVDDYVDDEGNVSFSTSSNNLDHLHPAWLCITLYEETGEEKYKTAAANIRAEFDNQPRNDSGGFWHKQKYENQMWLDGIYMAEPFLMRYGATFDDLEYASNEATKQAILIANHTYDSTLNLMVHGWDLTKKASWADSTTGRSPEVWSRAQGWYCMALVDILDYLPQTHKNYARLIEILKGLAVGIKEYQDEDEGLWYQVMDKGDSTDNWIETSGSAMFIYALKKAIDSNYIDSASYMPVVEKGWDGLKKYVTWDEDDQPVINHFVGGMGIKDSYSSYVSQTIVSTPTSNNTHGYCGILLAASAMEFPLPNYYTLEITKEGTGIVIMDPEANDYAEGTSVTLTAKSYSYSDYIFSYWKGDTVSTENPLTIKMDSTIEIEAVFIEPESSAVDEQVALEDIITVYPTPVQYSLTVSINKDLKVQSVYVFNSSGQQIVTQRFNCSDKNIDIDVSSLASGLYTIKIETSKGIFSKNFIKQ